MTGLPSSSPVARPAAPSVVGPPRPTGSEPGFPRKEEPVLAAFELTPTAPLDETGKRQVDCVSLAGAEALLLKLNIRTSSGSTLAFASMRPRGSR